MYSMYTFILCTYSIQLYSHVLYMYCMWECMLLDLISLHSVPKRNGDVFLEWFDDGGKLQSKKLREMDADEPQIKYFIAQLELFAKMCYYRQYLGSNKIKEQLPINVVLQ